MFCIFFLVTLWPNPVVSHTALFIPSATVLGQEGGSATLKCSSSNTELLMKWGYVTPGSSETKWLLYWSPGRSIAARMPGIEARFSESRASKYSLKIDNLRAEDSATYYCQSGEDGADWCGCGITLKVKPTVLPRPPSVNLHYAPPQKDSQQTESSLLCVSRGFYPQNISVSWYKGDREIFSGITHLRRLVDSNDYYSLISKLAISTSEWLRGSRYSCIVSHGALTSPLIRNISKNDGYIQEPVIQLISPRSDAVSAGQNVTVTCLVSDFYPADISVTWRDENGPVDTGVTQFAVALGSTGTYRTVSQLTVPTAEWESNHTYWCEVNHVSLVQTLQRAVTKDLGISSGTPGIMTPLRIVTVVGGLLLIIAAVTITYKITTSSSSTETANVIEMLSPITRHESVFENT